MRPCRFPVGHTASRRGQVKMKAFFKNYFKLICIGALMIAGLSLLLYPLVANTWNNHVQSKLVNNYTESVSEAIESGAINAEGELQKAYQYNED